MLYSVDLFSIYSILYFGIVILRSIISVQPPWCGSVLLRFKVALICISATTEKGCRHED